MTFYRKGVWPTGHDVTEILSDGHRFALVVRPSTQTILRDTVPEEPRLEPVAVIGCNPSTAGAQKPDATMNSVLRLCPQRSLHMLNLCPERATKIQDLRDVEEPGVTEVNLDEVAWRVSMVKLVVVAWGSVALRHPRTRDAIRPVLEVLQRQKRATIMCWGTNADGTPRHPLYLPTACTLVDYPGRA